MPQQTAYPDQIRSEQASTTIADLSRTCVIAVLLVFAGMLWPILLGHIHTSDDLWKYHFPIRKFYADCLSRGDSFDWMPSVFCGYFLTGTGQAGTYHPWHWVLYKFLPLNVAFTLEITASYPFMLLGMRLFLRRWVTRSDSAWLGAIVFTLSGFCLLHFLHPNAIAVVAHLPWLLYFIDQILRRGSRSSSSVLWRAELGLALLTGSQLLLGYPQYVWYSLLAESVYCVVVALRELPGRRALTLLCLLVGLKLIGAGVGAVQVLPSIAALEESDRTQVSAEELNRSPLQPVDMLQWFAPYLTSSRVFGQNTHELAVYCGAIPFLLALIALRRRGVDRSVRTLQVTMLALGLISLWLSFGADAGLYAIQMKLPLIGKFRWPSRIVVLLHFCVAILAAMSFDKAASQTLKPPENVVVQPRGAMVLMIVPVLSFIASIASLWLVPSELTGPRGLLVVGPILAALAAVMIFDLLRGRCSAGFMLFLVADLAVYGFTYEPLHQTQPLSVAFEQIEQPPMVSDEGRMLSQKRDGNGDVFYTGNQATLHGRLLADGYEGLMPKVSFLNRQLTVDSLRIAGVRWVPNSGAYMSIQGLKESSDSNWLEVPNPLPSIRLTTDVHLVRAIAEEELELQADGPTIVDPATGSERDNAVLATLEGHSNNIGSEPSSDAAQPVQLAPEDSSVGDQLEVVQSAPGQLRLKIASSGDRLLVWNQRYSTGWDVVEDGERRPAVRVDLDFLGTTVSAGTHSIDFQFQPPSLTWGRKITIGSLLMLSVWALFRRQRGHSKSEIVAAES